MLRTGTFLYRISEFQGGESVFTADRKGDPQVPV